MSSCLLDKHRQTRMSLTLILAPPNWYMYPLLILTGWPIYRLYFHLLRETTLVALSYTSMAMLVWNISLLPRQFYTIKAAIWKNTTYRWYKSRGTCRKAAFLCFERESSHGRISWIRHSRRKAHWELSESSRNEYLFIRDLIPSRPFLSNHRDGAQYRHRSSLLPRLWTSQAREDSQSAYFTVPIQ